MEERTKLDLKRRPFQFTGNASEYFRIWIVNVFFTILTLGIYSAWAKVRTKRYFYGNTLLDRAPFEYLASPIAILKGRLIIVSALGVYAVTTYFFPTTKAVFGLVLLVLMPWIVVKALTFNARNSSYRNIRFDFEANYGKAVRLFIGVPILIGLSLGLLYPAFVAWRNEFVVQHSRYGNTPFAFEQRLSGFYGIYLRTSGLFLLSLLVGTLGMYVLTLLLVDPGQSEQLAATGEEAAAGPAVLFTLRYQPILLVLLIYLIVGAYLKASIANLVLQQSRCGDHRFSSTLNPFSMIGLYLSNAVAIIVSVGLLIPWAKVRVARYRMEHLEFLAAGDLDGIVAAEQERVAAAGEEMSDLFDVELGL